MGGRKDLEDVSQTPRWHGSNPSIEAKMYGEILKEIITKDINHRHNFIKAIRNGVLLDTGT